MIKKITNLTKEQQIIQLKTNKMNKMKIIKYNYNSKFQT